MHTCLSEDGLIGCVIYRSLAHLLSAGPRGFRCVWQWHCRCCHPTGQAARVRVPSMCGPDRLHHPRMQPLEQRCCQHWMHCCPQFLKDHCCPEWRQPVDRLECRCWQQQRRYCCCCRLALAAEPGACCARELRRGRPRSYRPSLGNSPWSPCCQATAWHPHRLAAAAFAAAGVDGAS